MPRSQRILLRMGAVAVGSALAVLIIVFIKRDTTPAITRATLAQAVTRWNQAGPADYDVEVQTTGTRQDRHAIQVRDGEVVVQSINNHALSEDRFTDTWTVPRQFEYIRNDLGAAELPENQGAIRSLGVFDEKRGYPRQYRCITTNSRPSTSWEVIRFKVVNP